MKWLLILLFLLPLNAGAEEPEKLTLGVGRSIGFLPRIAEAEGFFAQEGLTVDYKKIETGKVIMDSLVSKDVDVGTLVDANIAFIDYQPNPVRVIATLGMFLDNSLWYMKSACIAEPKDLKGKAVGYTPGTTSHICLARFLAKNGLAWTDIKPVIVQPAAMENALRNGTVQAVATWQPWGYNIQVDMGDAIGHFPNDGTLYPSQILLATTADTLAKRPDALRKLVSALRKAAAFEQAEPEKTAELLAPEMSTTVAGMREILAGHRDKVGMDPAALPLITQIGEWIGTAQDEYQGKPLPDYAKSFSREIVDQP